MRILLVLVLLGCFIATHAMSDPYPYPASESFYATDDPAFTTAESNEGTDHEEWTTSTGSVTSGEEHLNRDVSGSEETRDNDSDSRDWTSDRDYDSSEEHREGRSSEDRDDSSGESSEEDGILSNVGIKEILGALFAKALEQKKEEMEDNWGTKSWKQWGHKGQDWRSGREDGTDERKHECPLKNKTEPILKLINETYHDMLNLPPPDSDENMAERTKFVKSFLEELKSMVHGQHGGHSPKPGQPGQRGSWREDPPAYSTEYKGESRNERPAETRWKGRYDNHNDNDKDDHRGFWGHQKFDKRGSKHGGDRDGKDGHGGRRDPPGHRDGREDYPDEDRRRKGGFGGMDHGRGHFGKEGGSDRRGHFGRKGDFDGRGHFGREGGRDGHSRMNQDRWQGGREDGSNWHRGGRDHERGRSGGNGPSGYRGGNRPGANSGRGPPPGARNNGDHTSRTSRFTHDA